MKRTLATVGLAVWATNAMADGTTLLQLCRSLIPIMEQNPKAGVSDEDLVGAGRCYGLIEGTVKTIKLMDQVHGKGPTMCSPDTVTPLQMAKIVVKFVEDNPKLLNESETGLIAMAAADAYPCKREQ